ncbi:hypothetical protein CS063_10360 [Sporanaerobium hydrogeniformans]|uniref:Uncharacterized protein n=1 Tax=Sporanaerobium hydrogeniformans TaxID=3072179 RepID=A0AC61DBS6_9FIRM|nr:FGGY family carbohydrate kinase [Sporanaerobium hydrogeniformans]PHV70482.1 hypothetical protein CS063_10360 [Sporanaerobium hydrogeniformans]
MKSIGIDIGTTSICGILVDATTGFVKKSITTHNDAFILTKNPWEKLQDPRKIEKKVWELLNKLLEEDVKSIGVTGQMHGILYVNKDGDAVSSLYTWQDGRGDLPYQGSTYAKYLHSYTGYGSVTDFYNQQNHLVPKDVAGLCTIQDYMVMKLVGKKQPLIHNSDAASFGCFDVKENKFKINNDLFPDFTNKVQVAGYYRNIPVSVAIGDNQASFIGAGCEEDSILVNVGTGSQVSLMTTEVIDSTLLEVRPLYDNNYIMVGSSLCGGRSFALLENFFEQVVEMATGEASGSLYTQMHQVITKCDKTDLVFNNKFCGTRGNPTVRGKIENLSLSNFTPKDFIIGNLYGIANELYEMYRLMPSKSGKMIGSGNGIRKNPALQKIFCLVFEKELLIPEHCEEAAFGAALFSMVASGMYKNFSEAREIINYVV